MKQYLKYLNDSGRKSACKQATSLLGVFSRDLKKHGKTLTNATANDVEAHMRTKIAPSTSNQFLAAITRYYRFKLANVPLENINRMVAEQQRLLLIGQISRRRSRETLEKSSLGVDDLKELLEIVSFHPVLHAGTVLLFYFGWRPKEASEYLRTAKINWGDRSMVIMTAKRESSEKYLPWHSSITKYLSTWHMAVTSNNNIHTEWLTKRLHKYMVGGVKVTSVTGRKTFETQMKLHAVDTYLIDKILGHTPRGVSRIGEKFYTDRTQFFTPIRDVMENHHYMITENII